MGHSKKKIKQGGNPTDRIIKMGVNPDSVYSSTPSWNFHCCDKEMWKLDKEHVGDLFWEDIFEKIKGFETRTWQDILIKDEKKNHYIEVIKLNKCAQTRLAILFPDLDEVISLRLEGTHRLYGYLSGSTYNIIWYDDNHGDNDSCVCRNYKKHT